MRKIDGLKFLQKHFPNLTVDCLFVDKVENLDEKLLYKKQEAEQVWRVRGGRKTGSELNLPQGTFTNPQELKQFMWEQQQKDSNMEFVIHRVSPEYFAAPFVGTLAVYNECDIPGIKIELQQVTKDLVNSIDKGKRPRDWEACLILDYEFLSKSPKVLKRDPNVDIDFLKYSIVAIHEVGEKIFSLYEGDGFEDSRTLGRGQNSQTRPKEAETYTRFNIYSLGQVLLDDHRSQDSFMQINNFQRTISNKQTNRIKEKELEL